MNKKYNDEDILRALVTQPTISLAAQELGCSTDTIYRRLSSDATLRTNVKNLRRQLTESVVEDMRNACISAINLIVETMENDWNDLPVRISCAKFIVSQSAKMGMLDGAGHPYDTDDAED